MESSTSNPKIVEDEIVENDWVSILDLDGNKNTETSPNQDKTPELARISWQNTGTIDIIPIRYSKITSRKSTKQNCSTKV